MSQQLSKTRKYTINSKPVRDAIRPFLFSIRKADVDHATPGDHGSCVLVQGVLRGLGDYFVSVSVRGAITYIEGKDEVLRYRTPDILLKALRKFDEKDENGVPYGKWDLPPGEYTLQVFKGERSGKNARSGHTRTKPPTRAKLHQILDKDINPNPTMLPARNVRTVSAAEALKSLRSPRISVSRKRTPKPKTLTQGG